MNPERIVEALLEGDLTPEEFMSNNPDMLAYFEFSTALSPNGFSVKRWSNGSYYYIGVVRYDPVNKVYYAYEVAPGNRRHMHYILKSEFRSTREKAAEDLWTAYSADGFL